MIIICLLDRSVQHSYSDDSDYVIVNHGHSRFLQPSIGSSQVDLPRHLVFLFFQSRIFQSFETKQVSL